MEMTSDQPIKRHRPIFIAVFIGAIAVAIVGAVTGFAIAREKAHAASPDELNWPQLMLRDGEMPSGSLGTALASNLPDTHLYKPSYYDLKGSFASNLRDGYSIAQLTVGVSTLYDSKVFENLKYNEIPIRSAIISIIADEDSARLKSLSGKRQLRSLIRDSINKILVAKTGYGGIDDVYFTSFIVDSKGE